jgi:CYTH domain-containing protein
MESKQEIERKFLLQAVPARDAFPRGTTVWSITQTYLKSGSGYSERVRWAINEKTGRTILTHAAKSREHGLVRLEEERIIDLDEYRELLEKRRDGNLGTIRKRRYSFEYAGRRWDLDEYLTEPRIALLEIELESPDDDVWIPDFVGQVRDVTSDPCYRAEAIAASARTRDPGNAKQTEERQACAPHEPVERESTSADRL